MESTETPVARRTGRNCSRRDGIRGGAVTGPWRSVGATPAPVRARGEAPGAALRPAAEPAVAAAPAARPAPQVAPAPEPARPARAESQRSVWIWSLFGLAVAGALVALAIVFRPDAPQPVVAAAPEIDAVPAPEPPAPEVVAPPPTAALINLRVSPDTVRTRRDTIVAALRSAGYDSVEVHVMPFPILRSRVGYFHGTDRPAAVALVAALEPVADATGGPLELRDYGPLGITADAGRLDLWIGE